MLIFFLHVKLEGQIVIAHLDKLRGDLEAAGLAGLLQVFGIQIDLDVIVGGIVRETDLFVEVQGHLAGCAAVRDPLIGIAGEGNIADVGITAAHKVTYGTAGLGVAAVIGPAVVGVVVDRLGRRKIRPVLGLDSLGLTGVPFIRREGRNGIAVGLVAVVILTVGPGIVAIIITSGQTDTGSAPVLLRPEDIPVLVIVRDHVRLEHDVNTASGDHIPLCLGRLPLVADVPLLALIAVNGTQGQAVGIGAGRILAGHQFKAVVQVHPVVPVNIGVHERFVICHLIGNDVHTVVGQLRLGADLGR